MLNHHTPHTPDDELILRYVAKRLSEEELTVFEAHLTECMACREGVSEWRMMTDMVKQHANQTALTLPPLKIPVSSVSVQSRGEPIMMNSAAHSLKVTHLPRTKPAIPMTLVATLMIFTLVIGALVFNRQNMPSLLPLAVTQTEDTLPTVYEYLQQNERFSRFLALFEQNIYRSWLMDILKGDEPITVFVVEDQPLRELSFSRDPTQDWSQSVWMHIIKGTWSYEQLIALSGEEITSQWEKPGDSIKVGIKPFQLDNSGLWLLHPEGLSEMQVVERDIPAANGVIHVTDRLLVPWDILVSIQDQMRERDLFWAVAKDDRLTQFNAILVRSIGSDYLRHPAFTTVFAPTDGALAPILETFDLYGGLDDVERGHLTQFAYAHISEGIWSTELLLDARSIGNRWLQMGIDESIVYRNRFTAIETMLGDGTQRILINNRSTVVEGNIIATNGVLHIIDQPLVDLEH